MKILVIGAGGHAKVVIDALENAGHEIAAVVDERNLAADVCGYPTVRSDELPAADGFIVAIGDNETRKRRYEHYSASGLAPVAVIHPDAIIASGATIGAGAAVFAGVVVNRDATIGENAILNTGCTVDHDCVVGAHAHIAPGANLCGGVRVGEGTLVGVGSAVVPGASIGAWSVCGAGTTVVENVSDRLIVAGCPARPVRPTGGAE